MGRGLETEAVTDKTQSHSESERVWLEMAS